MKMLRHRVVDPQPKFFGRCAAFRRRHLRVDVEPFVTGVRVREARERIGKRNILACGRRDLTTKERHAIARRSLEPHVQARIV